MKKPQLPNDLLKDTAEYKLLSTKSDDELFGSRGYPLDPQLGDPRYYQYHPEGALGLGLGFSPHDPSNPKRPGLVFSEVVVDSGAPSTDVSLTYVRSQEEVNYAFKIDSKVEASFLKSKVSLNRTSAFDYALLDTSISVVMTVFSNFGRWGIDANARLSDDAKASLSDSKKFAETYGTRYVRFESRAASVSVLITLRSVSRSSKESFSSEFSATGGWGQLSASASQKLSTELKIAAKQSRLSITINANGGVGPAAFGDSLKALATVESEPISAIQSALGAYVSSIKKENASPVWYAVATMAHFGWDESSVAPWTDHREKSVRYISTEYQYAVRQREIIDEIEGGRHPILLLMPEKVDLEEISAKKNALDRRIIELEETHSKLKRDSNFIFEPADIKQSKVSVFDEDAIRALEPPSFSIEICDPQGEEKLSLQQVRLVLSYPPEERLVVVQKFRPSWIGFICKGVFSGVGFFSRQFVAIYSDGSEQNGKIHPYSGNPYDVWDADIPNGRFGYERDELREWAASARGSFQATICFRIVDRANRAHLLRLMELDWTVNTKGEVKKYVSRMLV